MCTVDCAMRLSVNHKTQTMYNNITHLSKKYSFVILQKIINERLPVIICTQQLKSRKLDHTHSFTQDTCELSKTLGGNFYTTGSHSKSLSAIFKISPIFSNNRYQRKLLYKVNQISTLCCQSYSNCTDGRDIGLRNFDHSADRLAGSTTIHVDNLTVGKLISSHSEVKTTQLIENEDQNLSLHDTKKLNPDYDANLSIPQKFVQSSPASVIPYLQLMRLDRPIGKFF